MPVHNGAAYLTEAIESIMKQTYPHFEVIIVDDASTDTSWNIITEYKALYPQTIHAIRLKKSLGKSGDPATNLAIQHAHGAYIAKMDADDIAHPKRLEKQVEYLQSHSEIFMVGTQAYVIDKVNEVIGKKQAPLTHAEIYCNFFSYNYMIHPSIMFRNEARYGEFYHIKFAYFNEYYTFFRLMNQGKQFANVPEYLMYYRIHGKNDTFSRIKKKFLSTLAIKKKFITQLGYTPTFSQIAFTLAQSVGVFLIPEKMTVLFYLLSRRVMTPRSILASAKQLCSLSIGFTKQFASSFAKIFI